METKKKQFNWYAIWSQGVNTHEFVFASNIEEARTKFKTYPQYAELYKKYKKGYKLKRVYMTGDKA